MTRLRTLMAAGFLLLAIPFVARATQIYLASDDNTSIGSVVLQILNVSGKAVPVSSSNPIPVSGSFSATLNGFTPNGSFATLTSTQAGSASTALPTGTVVDLVNTGTTAVSCTPAAGAATAALNNLQVAPGGGHTPFVVGTYVNIACKNQGGDTASNVIVMVGGAGLANTSGGGGGSVGGGGAITAASGSYATGAMSAGSYAAGALAAGAFATGAGVDGWDLTQGAKADPVCATSSGTCSVVSLLKYLNGQAATIAANSATSIPVNVGPTPTAVNGHTVGGNTGMDINVNSVNNAAIKGGMPVVNGGNTYNTIAASQTAQVLSSTNGGATGATGDYLSHCTIYPTSTSPGAVTVYDGATSSAATQVINFPGGASSLSNLVPFSFPVGAVSTSGGWHVTTGANESLVCYGKFT